MAKIQARNVDDSLYQLIEQSAMRNERSIEGEIRTALREYYQPVVQEDPFRTSRERWQKETGQRLGWIFDRLCEDNYFREFGSKKKAGTAEIVRLARRLDVSPGLLMDLMEGHSEMTTTMADRIASELDISASWLLTGERSPFPVVSLGMDYPGFFIPSGDNGRYIFEFIRISKGRHEGTLICLRIHPDSGHMALGVVTAEFKLCNDGSGGTGHGKLLAFLLYLKTCCARLPMNAFNWAAEDGDFDFWSVVGQHHPVYFQDFRHRETAGWLQQLLAGEDPDEWFRGWRGDLEKIGNTPFGGKATGDNPAPSAGLSSGERTVDNEEISE